METVVASLGRDSPGEALLEEAAGRAEICLDVAEKLLKETAVQLDAIPDTTARAQRHSRRDDKADWYRFDIYDVTRALGYRADLGSYAGWTRLSIERGMSGVSDEIVIAAHGYGESFRGIIAFAAFVLRREPRDDGQRGRSTPEPLSDEPFLIPATEDPQVVGDRFDPWLNEAVIRGISSWYREMSRSESP